MLLNIVLNLWDKIEIWYDDRNWDLILALMCDIIPHNVFI